jgi:hypothetical protein
VLLRLAYLGVTNAFAMLRLLPMSDQAKNAEIALYRAKSYVTALTWPVEGAATPLAGIR